MGEREMQRFDGKIAVITGGGTGMGRELARQLAAEGCHIAMCDVSAENMQATRALCERENRGVRVTTHVADVSNEAQVVAFRDAVMREHATRCVHLVFANAGIGGGGSFVNDGREEWDKTFAVCWGGVYFTARAFVPLLVAAPEGWLVNTASVNGFWASLGPKSAHSAHSAARFAVKGFSEALINDFKVNAPYVGVSVVMPGHMGTAIAKNSAKVLGRAPNELSEGAERAAAARCARAHGARRAPRRRPLPGAAAPRDDRDGGCLRERRAHRRGAGGEDHPRRRARETLAHPRGARRAGARPTRARGAGRRLRRGVRAEARRRGELEAGRATRR
jgi:NAD(P)-dependent dehydrogenase (short-subunit alcohol dehydrogenase family)